MLWHGIMYSCGLWLPEEKKKLIRGMERKIVVLIATCLPQLPVQLKQYNGNFLYTSPFFSFCKVQTYLKFLTVLLKYI